MVHFIHAADLHLDSPFRGLREVDETLFDSLYQSTFRSVEQLVETAIDEAVDFVVMSGDIYDEENQSVKAQAFLREEMGKLNRAGIRVFLSHGNHDFLGREALKLQLPENVHVFQEAVETVTFTTAAGETVAITGFSYPTRWVTERMIQQYPLRYPVDVHIGMLHGYLESLRSQEGVYAPFSLSELNEKQYDYWALGHIHKRQILQQNPPAVYSGNTQGRNPNETEAKGAYLVTLQKGLDPELTFLATAPVIWQRAVLSLKHCHQLNDVYLAVETYLDEALEKQESESVLLSLTCTDLTGLPAEVTEKLNNGEILEGTVQLRRGKGGRFIYLYALTVEVTAGEQLFQLDDVMEQSYARRRREIEAEDYAALMEPFFQHAVIRRLFPDLKQDETLKQAVLEAADRNLYQDIQFQEMLESEEEE